MASKAEIRAVRKVLYDRGRLRELLDEVRSIDVLMNTDPRANLPPDDIRVSAGSGPVWVIPSTGEIDPGVLEAAARCRRVAELLRATRAELSDVDFDDGDRRQLSTALDQHAKAWIARARAWSAPGPPDDVRAVAKEINRHDAKAVLAYARVEQYLDRDALNGIR